MLFSLVPVFEDQLQALVLVLLAALFETFQFFNRPVRCQRIIAIRDPRKCNPVQPLRQFRLLQVEWGCWKRDKSKRRAVREEHQIISFSTSESMIGRNTTLTRWAASIATTIRAGAHSMSSIWKRLKHKACIGVSEYSLAWYMILLFKSKTQFTSESVIFKLTASEVNEIYPINFDLFCPSDPTSNHFVICNIEAYFVVFGHVG